MTGNSLGLELSGGFLLDNTAIDEKDKLESLFPCLTLLIQSPNAHIYCTRTRLHRPRSLLIFTLLKKPHSSLRYLVKIW